MADPFSQPATGFRASPLPSSNFTMGRPGAPDISSIYLPVATPGLPLLAVWSVPQPEKAKSDQLFANIDQDHDGLVSGSECKPMFLQSGLSPPILAQIWALCDIRKNGVLNSEQFALAVFLIQMKLRQGLDPPASLPPDLVPPSMRSYVTQYPVPVALLQQPDLVDDDEGGDEGLKKELKELEDEIAGIKRDKEAIVTEVEGRKAEMQMRHTELQNLAKELDALQAAAKQLDVQRGEAQKRLDDLDGQKGRLQTSVTNLTQELDREKERTRDLTTEFERRQTGQKEQDEDMANKRKELQKMKQEEAGMQYKLDGQKQQLLVMERSITEGDVRISQLEGHVSQIESLNETLKEAIGQFDSALASNDQSSINPIYLQKPVTELTFNASSINLTPITIPTHQATAPPPQTAVTTFDDPYHGSDPFARGASTAHQQYDFGATDTEDPWGASPFGGADSFGAFGGGGGFAPQQGPESPLPALPPKKAPPPPASSGASRAPPPRPAPPKATGGKSGGPGKKEQAAPARDAFEGDPWGSGGAGATGSSSGFGFASGFEQPAPASFATDFDDFGKF